MAKKKQTEYMKFVENELDLLAKEAENGKQMDELKRCVMPLCELFETESGRINGAKSKIMLRLFAKLASWVPLTPLMGTVDEWTPCNDPKDKSTDIMYQNKRCSHVYKRKDGTCFDSEAVLFSYDGIMWFRNKESNVDIEFPYMVPVSPKRIMLDKSDDDTVDGVA